MVTPPVCLSVCQPYTSIHQSASIHPSIHPIHSHSLEHAFLDLPTCPFKLLGRTLSHMRFRTPFWNLTILHFCLCAFVLVSSLSFALVHSCSLFSCSYFHTCASKYMQQGEQPGQDSQNRKARAGQPEEDSQLRTGRTRMHDRTFKKRRPGQNRNERIARKRQPEQDS
jgi:hypothetical protein